MVQPDEHSRHGRQLRFTHLDEVKKQEQHIRFFLSEAIRGEEAGLSVPPAPSELDVPVELLEEFNNDPTFEQAFYSLTPGRRRGYIIYFNQPKQSQTRINRIEKYKSQILSGLGMQDSYRNSLKNN